ncbi:MAG: hypothetical protein H6835_09965 [Planctomycetes bacterium]|nr:hypothetical protein [Planctomycetota bacterium]
MGGIIVKVAVGLLLFVGALVGGLAATGRLNHEGTANIPLLNSLFPEPPAAPEGEGGEHGAVDATMHAAPGGETAAVGMHGEAGVSEASLGGGQEPKRPNRSKTGRSLHEPEKAEGGGHGGGAAEGGHGGGEAEHGGGEADHGSDAGHEDAGHADGGHADAGHGGGHGEPQSPAKDFDHMQVVLQSQGKTGYSPGAYFTFEGMPAGLTPEQLNDAWQRVQGIVAEMDRRKAALDQREKELTDLADDINRRQKDLGTERLEVEQMQNQLDAKIRDFEKTVKLVRNEEMPLLKRNAETIASLEVAKATELIQQQWATERGQDEVVKLLEFMKQDKITELLGALPTAMVQDILKRRMQVRKEAKPSGRGG